MSPRSPGCRPSSMTPPGGSPPRFPAERPWSAGAFSVRPVAPSCDQPRQRNRRDHCSHAAPRYPFGADLARVSGIHEPPGLWKLRKESSCDRSCRARTSVRARRTELARLQCSAVRLKAIVRGAKDDRSLERTSTDRGFHFERLRVHALSIATRLLERRR